jgi:hypothetical protein
VVFAVVVVALLFILQMFAAGPIVRLAVEKGLENANGATVDLAEADLNLKENKLILGKLAMADPNALDTDLFRAEQLEADISGMSLLRKQIQLDRVVIRDASHGEKRAKPGRLIGPPPEPTSPPPTDPEIKSIDDYLQDAKVWKERLTQVKRWLEELSGPEADRTAGTDPETGQERTETLSERLAREVREKGYAQVRASHLVVGAPTVTVNELQAEKVRVTGLEDQTLDISATNLSTHPKLLGREPKVVVRSSADTLGLDLALGEFAPSPGKNLLEFFYKGLDTDEVAKQLKAGDNPPVQGGTMDLQAKGEWFSAGGVQVDLPFQATLHNATISLPGTAATKVETFTLPIGVRGPLDNPRVQIDDKQLASALKQAGLSAAKAALTDKAKEALSEQAGDQIGEAGKGLLNNILGGRSTTKTNK